jgi:sodium transport system permease protein
MLVPMMLIMYCCIGSASIACDITVGEKERGTLESLLSTGANRMAIVIGKLWATTAVGVTSGICTVLGLWGYIFISSSNSPIKLTGLELFLVFLLIFLTAMFFAAINLTIGIFSKSFKEAQVYMIPISMFSIIPSYLTNSMSLNSIGLTYFCIPVLNIVCAIKEIFAGILNFAHLGIVFAWLIFYIILAFFATIKIFKKETVLFRI